MAESGTRYFEEREAELVAAGVDPDDDDEWAQPDNDEPVYEHFCDRPYYRGDE
jgi:hypothetical protein